MEVGLADGYVCSIILGYHFSAATLRASSLGLAHCTRDDDVYDGYFIPKGNPSSPALHVRTWSQKPLISKQAPLSSLICGKLQTIHFELKRRPHGTHPRHL